MLDKLVDVLNETLESSDMSRGMVTELLTKGGVTFSDGGATLPEDLIVQEHESGKPFRVSMLGIFNTALTRAGEPRRLIAVVGDDERLVRVEAGPYPAAVQVEVPETCDHHWMEWRGHHDHENEGRMRCTRCSKFKGDL